MWQIDEVQLTSRLLLGTARYPSLSILQQAIKASGTEVVTVALRRQAPDQKAGQQFWQNIKDSGCHILPNTAGCFSVKEAVTTAEMARELFSTNWIKLEVIGNDYNLQPDPFGLVEAARELVKRNFVILPYCTEDLVLCERLVDYGCQILMPWGSPIGSGRGLMNPYALQTLRQRFPKITLIVDAGIGKVSHAVQAMEWGYDAVLLNSAVALAHDPVCMAQAFREGVSAGRSAYLSGLIPERSTGQPSTPTLDTPFWQQEAFDE